MEKIFNHFYVDLFVSFLSFSIRFFSSSRKLNDKVQILIFVQIETFSFLFFSFQFDRFSFDHRDEKL